MDISIPKDVLKREIGLARALIGGDDPMRPSALYIETVDDEVILTAAGHIVLRSTFPFTGKPSEGGKAAVSLENAWKVIGRGKAAGKVVRIATNEDNKLSIDGVFLHVGIAASDPPVIPEMDGCKQFVSDSKAFAAAYASTWRYADCAPFEIMHLLVNESNGFFESTDGNRLARDEFNLDLSSGCDKFELTMWPNSAIRRLVKESETVTVGPSIAGSDLIVGTSLDNKNVKRVCVIPLPDRTEKYPKTAPVIEDAIQKIDEGRTANVVVGIDDFLDVVETTVRDNAMLDIRNEQGLFFDHRLVPATRKIAKGCGKALMRAKQMKEALTALKNAGHENVRVDALDHKSAVAFRSFGKVFSLHLIMPMKRG